MVQQRQHTELGRHSYFDFDDVSADDVVIIINRLPNKTSAAGVLSVTVLKQVAIEVALFLVKLSWNVSWHVQGSLHHANYEEVWIRTRRRPVIQAYFEPIYGIKSAWGACHSTGPTVCCQRIFCLIFSLHTSVTTLPRSPFCRFCQTSLRRWMKETSRRFSSASSIWHCCPWHSPTAPPAAVRTWWSRPAFVSVELSQPDMIRSAQLKDIDNCHHSLWCSTGINASSNSDDAIHCWSGWPHHTTWSPALLQCWRSADHQPLSPIRCRQPYTAHLSLSRWKG